MKLEQMVDNLAKAVESTEKLRSETEDIAEDIGDVTEHEGIDFVRSKLQENRFSRVEELGNTLKEKKEEIGVLERMISHELLKIDQSGPSELEFEDYVVRSEKVDGKISFALNQRGKDEGSSNNPLHRWILNAKS